MSEKSIELNQGGEYNFRITKAFKESGEQRFSVEIDPDGYRSGRSICDSGTWVEATNAMNKFRDEFDDAFEALVQISTLTPVGVHEES